MSKHRLRRLVLSDKSRLDGIEPKLELLRFVDDVTFEVVDVLNEMGLATILLKRGKDRRRYV